MKPEIVAQNIAALLMSHGYITAESVKEVCVIITPSLQIPESPVMNFKQDIEFLKVCIEDRSKSFFLTRVKPFLLTFLNGSKQRVMTGRMFRDEEIHNFSTDLTEIIYSMLGERYRTMLHKYMNDEEGLISYIYTTVRDKLTEMGTEFNSEFLEEFNRRYKGNGVSERIADDVKKLNNL